MSGGDRSARTDVLVVVAHPDDEIAWFGGLIPLHVALGRRVTVLCMTPGGPPGSEIAAVRAGELRASLRTCGLEDPPLWGGFEDCGWIEGGGFRDLDWVWARWGGRDAVRDALIGVYARERPVTVFAHNPETGDYGHPNHMASGQACIDAFEACQRDPDLVGDPDCLRRLYVSSRVGAPGAGRVDWHRPLDRFDGRTAAEVAASALRCHRSQDCHAIGVRDHLAYELRCGRGDDDDVAAPRVQRSGAGAR